MSELKEAIASYFRIGLSHRDIQQYLWNFNGKDISLRTLRRHLKNASLFRRRRRTNILDVALFMTEEIETSRKLYGYKLMHLKCIQNGFVVSQDTVRILLQIIDSEGVKKRSRRRLVRRAYSNPGPNFVWHVDSYDKLKPYGICINGAIDGYSRFVLWLKAYITNSDPKVVGNYFVETVRALNGCPVRVRADLGTENGHIENIQKFFRFDHTDCFSRHCFIYGSSNHNQRIESWWSYLRQHNVQYWINKFQELKDADLFTGDYLDKSLVQFCFLNIIQEELDSVVQIWNSHRIRSYRNRTCPCDRPVTLFGLPQQFGSEDYKCTVGDQHLEVASEECVSHTPYSCDKDVFDLCCLFMSEHDIQHPLSTEEAFRLYEILRTKIRAEL